MLPIQMQGMLQPHPALLAVHQQKRDHPMHPVHKTITPTQHKLKKQAGLLFLQQPHITVSSAAVC